MEDLESRVVKLQNDYGISHEVGIGLVFVVLDDFLDNTQKDYFLSHLDKKMDDFLSDDH